MHIYVSFISFGKIVCKHTKYMSKFHISMQILQGNALFSGKITQLETILHDRRSRRSRLISSLADISSINVIGDQIFRLPKFLITKKCNVVTS